MELRRALSAMALLILIVSQVSYPMSVQVQSSNTIRNEATESKAEKSEIVFHDEFDRYVLDPWIIVGSTNASYGVNGVELQINSSQYEEVFRESP